MQQVVLLGKVSQGREEASQIGPEEKELTKGRRAGIDSGPSLDDDGHQCDHRQDLDGGKEQCIPEDAVEVRFSQGAIDPGIALSLLFFTAADLHHFHATDRFLGVGIEVGEASSHLAVVLACELTKNRGGHHNQRCHQQDHGSEFCVGIEEHRNDSGDGEKVPRQRHETTGKQIVESFDIVGHSCHETPDRITVVETGTLFLEV